jgi:hypothetical protein
VGIRTVSSDGAFAVKSQLLLLIVAGDKNSHLPRLLRCLLTLASRRHDQKVSAEACNCLAVIGPVDIGIVALPPTLCDTDLQSSLDRFPSDQRNFLIFHTLNNYLVANELVVYFSLNHVITGGALAIACMV